MFLKHREQWRYVVFMSNESTVHLFIFALTHSDAQVIICTHCWSLKLKYYLVQQRLQLLVKCTVSDQPHWLFHSYTVINLKSTDSTVQNHNILQWSNESSIKTYIYTVFHNHIFHLVLSQEHGMEPHVWPSRLWSPAPCRLKLSCRRLRSWRNSDTRSWCSSTQWCLRNRSTSSLSTWAKVSTDWMGHDWQWQGSAQVRFREKYDWKPARWKWNFQDLFCSFGL